MEVHYVCLWREPRLYGAGECRFANPRCSYYHHSIKRWVAERFYNRVLKILPDQ